MKNTLTGVLARTVAAFALFSALALTGCGGSDGTKSLPASNASTFISRETEAAFSDDTKILLTRTVSGPFLPLTDANGIDTDLKTIRQQYPAVIDVHATSTWTLTELLVTVKPDAAFLSRWQTGGDPTTGEPALDALLAQYGVTAVQPLGGTQFALVFGQSLNMEAVAPVFSSAGTSIAAASTNLIHGESDQIVRTVRSDGTRVYTFTHGYGDCAAGCLAHHNWEFVMASDGKSSTLTESGNPLP